MDKKHRPVVNINNTNTIVFNLNLNMDVEYEVVMNTNDEYKIKYTGTPIIGLYNEYVGESEKEDKGYIKNIK